MSAVMVEDQRIVADVAEAGWTFDAGRRETSAWVACQLDTGPVADVLGTEVGEDQRERSLEVVPADVAVELQEEGEGHYRISTCDYSAAAALVAIVAGQESHIGSQDVPHRAVKEDLLLSKPVGLVLGVEGVVEGRRSLWEATVRSSVVEQTAPVAEEGRGEE